MPPHFLNRGKQKHPRGYLNSNRNNLMTNIFDSKISLILMDTVTFHNCSFFLHTLPTTPSHRKSTRIYYNAWGNSPWVCLSSKEVIHIKESISMRCTLSYLAWGCQSCKMQGHLSRPASSSLFQRDRTSWDLKWSFMQHPPRLVSWSADLHTSC